MLGFTEKAGQTPNLVLLTRLASKIVDRGMTIPAVFALEMMKPLAFIGSQALVFFGPIITTFIRSETYYEVTELLEDHKNVAFLIDELERLDADIQKTRGKGKALDKITDCAREIAPKKDH